ncbi:hypothetical protein [Desulfosporosinus shakirovi]|uniref:hypothetical protein n=1 Tax=Desulfosporosinus shakirovi TaxID=2885154 RepID=UPI001E56839F|nr:hypothetical protein [Desulfosporosinus sp. SRJS8]MCB8818667.1 hypothetical protein [Desulfosporosinus sp. SRJS8]
MKLYLNGELVKKGQVVETFRGEKCTVISWIAPHKPSSSGKVYVKFGPLDKYGQEIYPSVIGSEFRKEEGDAQ